MEPEAWTGWWEHNRDAYLWDLSTRDETDGPVTAAGASLGLGEVVALPTALPHAPSPALIGSRVVPALLRRLETEEDGGALAEAVLALGRVAPAPLAQSVTDALLPLLAHHDTRVAESVAVAFGLLGTDDAHRALDDLSTCSPIGHRLARRSSVPDGLRIAAALSLGLLGDERSAPRLRSLAEGDLDAGDDLRAGAVLALGLMASDDDAGTAAWIDRWSRDRHLPLKLQVSLATSLGRLRHPGAVAALEELLADRDVDSPTRQAAVAALGRAATLDDEAAVRALLKVFKSSRDSGTRQLTLISLAQLATAEPATDEGRDGRRAIDKLVRRELRKPTRSLDRPFTALAAGLLLRGRPDLLSDLGSSLLDRYEDASDPNQRGAFALALGLSRLTDGAPILRADLEDTRDEGLQGHLAVALGLLGDDDAASLLRERLMGSGASPSLREALATGLRLLDDGATLPLVANAYLEASNGSARLGLAAALGALRHGDGVEALLAACSDDDLDAGSRASAYAALGRLAETTAEPFASRLTRDDAPAHAHTAVAALAVR